MGDQGHKVPHWLQNLISGTYLTKDCACRNQRPCQSFFCVLCSQDHLCHEQFETAGGPHFGHDKLRVRKGSRRYAVTDNNLKAYMDTKLVQKFIINEEEICFLKPKERSGPGSSVSAKDGQLRACKICGGSLQSSATQGSFCSLECLMRGASPESSEDNEMDIAPSSTSNKPELQKGPTRKLAPKATHTQDDNFLPCDQIPPGALKRKLSGGAGPSCRRLKPAPPPEATPTATRVEATEVGPSSDQTANLPTTSGRRGQRQTNISASNLVQGETSAERSKDQDWLLNTTTATLEAPVENSNCSKEEVDMLVDDKSVNLLLHFSQSAVNK